MLGLMMDRPLTLAAVARHAERNHGTREVVSITADHARHRYTFAECFARAALEQCVGAAGGGRRGSHRDCGLE